jgi:hypothetical protein
MPRGEGQHRINLFGATIGRLTITGHIGYAKGRTWWNARCACGQNTIVTTLQLRRAVKPTRSCGCLTVEATKRRQLERRVTPWGSMFRQAPYRQWWRLRRQDPALLCDEWRESFRPVADWLLSIGWTPGHRMVRLDGHQPYGPENVMVIPTKRGVER